MEARWAVLLVFLAFQACSAQKLVNLVEKHETFFAPNGYHGSFNDRLFDRDLSTYEEVAEVKLLFQPAYPIRPTKYRITMAAHVKPKDYPTEWGVTVTGGRKSFYDYVQRAVFKNGVYEVPLSKKIEASRLRFNWHGRQLHAIAEIEVLGPRKSLNALWPYGKYPCSERLAIITRLRGPKVLFSKSKQNTSREGLRRVFDAKDGYGRDFYFDGQNPIVIGAVLQKATVVHEISIVAFKLRRKGVRQVILEGNKCDPRSNTGGSCSGWKKLAAAAPLPEGSEDQEAPRLFVKNPGKYRAYRLKFIPNDEKARKADGKSINLQGIFFLGCTA